MVLCRAVTALKAVGAALAALDRLAFVHAVVAGDSTTAAEQPRAAALVPATLLRRQPAALPMLRRACRFLALALRLLRERILTQFADTSDAAAAPAAAEGGGGGKGRSRKAGAEATRLRAAHELALHVAVAHEVWELTICSATSWRKSV